MFVWRISQNSHDVHRFMYPKHEHTLNQDYHMYHTLKCVTDDVIQFCIQLIRAPKIELQA